MNRSVQAHPFHLVEASPWPIAVSFSLLVVTLSGVMTFQGYSNGLFLLTLGFISLVSTMTLWFKDISREGMEPFHEVLSINLTVCWKLLRAFGTKLVTIQKIGQSAGNQTDNIRSRILRDYTLNIGRFMLSTSSGLSTTMKSNNKLNEYKHIGSYLAGLLEGDGHIKIQSSESTSKKINPRFVFTFHTNNLSMYDELHQFVDSGFFKTGSNNTIRFVVADKKGVLKLTNLMNGYLRTPKILTFHKLIDKLNLNNSLEIPKLPIDNSSLDDNAWLAGFTEADGYFGVFISEYKPKSEDRKRSQSRRVKCRFAIEQRQFDRPTNSSCKPYMKMIANFFNVTLLENTRTTFNIPNSTYYIHVESREKLSKVIAYFDKYPLMGEKGLDYQDFKTVYSLILTNNHLTDLGREEIKRIVTNIRLRHNK